MQKSLEIALFEKENLQRDLSKAISDRKTLEEKIEEKIKSAPQTNQQEVISKLVSENTHLKKFFEKFQLS